MKNIVFILIVLLSLTACKRGWNEIPEEYSFLLGEWKNKSDLPFDVIVKIDKSKLIITRGMTRTLIFHYTSIKMDKFKYDGIDDVRISIHLNRNLLIRFDESNKDTIVLFSIERYNWKGLRRPFDFSSSRGLWRLDLIKK